MAHFRHDGDDRLLVRAADDADAFATFYRRYEPAVLAFFVRRLSTAELAADLTAEVFAAALAGCRRYRPAEGPCHAWLFGIARHKLMHSRRRGRVEHRARGLLGMAPIALEDEALARIETLTATSNGVLGALNGLPADQRQAVVMRIVDERDYRDIATELRCSESVVRKRVSRGLSRLREQIGEQTT